MVGRLRFPRRLAPSALHPYGDFLMHDVGTGDGILQAIPEHYGRRVFQRMADYMSKQDFESSRNKIRTAPLWGVRLRPRLMHDGASLTFLDAIGRHRGEASQRHTEIRQAETLRAGGDHRVFEVSVKASTPDGFNGAGRWKGCCRPDP